MSERTADERSSFGKIKTEGLALTEEKIDWLVSQYESDSYSLLKDTLERSKDRFVREFSKLEAASAYLEFYTEKGVEDRRQRLKFKVL